MTSFQPFDWYEDALYYDIIFDADTREEADFLEAVREQYVLTKGRRILEPACGSGRLVAEMARRGYGVAGFDISPGMLRFARQRLRRKDLSARLLNTRMERFDIRPPFDLAHCLVSTFKYLPSDRAARSHLQCVAKALKPDGVYVLGLHLTDYADRARNRERWVASRKGIEVTCNIQGWPADPRTRTERVRSRLIVREKGCERRLETHWTFRTYSLRQLRGLLKSVPALEHVDTYDFTCNIEKSIPFDGEQLDTILILRRR